jgi:hypothetical protein
MPDHFIARKANPVPVPAGPDKPRTILNSSSSRGALYYKNAPSYEPFQGKRLAPGQSATVTERVWLLSDSESSVIVEP